MLVLTEHNKEFDMAVLAQHMSSKGVIEYSEKSIFYTVVDWTKQKLPDYLCRDLEKNKVDSYTDSAVRLRIGAESGVELVLPFKWHVLIVAVDEVQYLSLEEIIGREFSAFAFNPFSGFMPNMLPIRAVEMIPKYEFLHPKMNKQEMLAIPVGYEKDPDNNPRPYPLCIFAGEKSCRVPPHIDMGKLWG